MLNCTRLAGTVLLAGLAASGCIIIPVDYYCKGCRTNIGTSPLKSISAGETSREDVLLLLGEPDRHSSDEAEFWYETEKIKAWVLAVGSTSAAGGELKVHYRLILFFDQNGIVRSQFFKVF